MEVMSLLVSHQLPSSSLEVRLVHGLPVKIRTYVPNSLTCMNEYFIFIVIVIILTSIEEVM